MKKPPTSNETHREPVCQSQQSSSGAMARVRRFFSMSLTHKKPQPSLHQAHQSTKPSHQLLRNLKNEADKILSRPLDEVIHQQEDEPHGVPILVHNLCYHMIHHGTDYDTLMSDTWDPNEIRNWLRQIEIDSPACHLHLSDEGALGPYRVAGLLRLFLTELPHPLLTKPVASSIFRVYKDQSARGVYEHTDADVKSRSMEVRTILASRLPENNLRLLTYLCSFLHQLTNNYSGRQLSETSKVLGRVLCDQSPETYQNGGSYRLALLLLKDYDQIFSEPITPLDDGEYNSDSLSSIGDSPSDNTDADQFTPDDCLGKSPEDDSSTTSDTDDFRSLPVSPLREPAWSQSSRSTKEAADINRVRKISANTGKDKIRSITDLLSSPDDSSRDEGTRLNSLERNWTQLGHESYASAGEDSDGVESETARDADRSDADEIIRHEIYHERRFSDRSYPKTRKGSSSGKKSRRKIRRKNSKDMSAQEPSSEEEEADERNDNCPWATNEDEPRKADEGSLGFRDLLASNEPVTSDRASWGSKMYDIDETHRTAPRYSRFEDDSPNKGSWYQDLDSPACESYHQRSDGSNGQSHPAIKVLMRSISSVKRQIRKFEKEFESNNGYKPSHSDKMKDSQIKDLMSEMKEMRRELKQLKDDVTGFIMPKSFRSRDPVSSSMTPSAQLMRQIEESLRQKRSRSHRPQELPAMATEDLKHEKANLQEALLYYERSCGRPISHEDKTNAKHLYKRYRAVKQRLNAGDTSPELIPIVENVETVFLETASPLHRGSLQNEEDIKVNDEILRTLPMNQDPHPDNVPGTPERSNFNLSDLHSLPAHELRERKKIAKENKKTLKRALRKFELNFENNTGRKVSKDDRGPMEKIYMEYKLAKAKLKLLNALLAKDEQRNIAA